MASRREIWAKAAVVALLFAFAVSYTCGYFTLGNPRYSQDGRLTARYYPQRWQARIYQPAGKLESTMRRQEVWVHSWEIFLSPE